MFKKKETALFVVSGLVVISAILWLMGHPRSTGEPAVTSGESVDTVTKNKTIDAKNITLTIDEQAFTLRDGIAEVPTVPESTSVTTVRYFGNDAQADLNGDGVVDDVFLVTEDGGGSGMFYYAVAVLSSTSGYHATNAVFVGDRIAPQPIIIDEATGRIAVNYATRTNGEPMTATPSEGKTLWLIITADGQLEAASY